MAGNLVAKRDAGSILSRFCKEILDMKAGGSAIGAAWSKDGVIVLGRPRAAPSLYSRRSWRPKRAAWIANLRRWTSRIVQSRRARPDGFAERRAFLAAGLGAVLLLAGSRAYRGRERVESRHGRKNFEPAQASLKNH